MLIFTNRNIDLKQSDDRALTATYTPLIEDLSAVSVLENTTGKKRWSVTDVSKTISDAQAVSSISKLMSGSKPILVYIHGNNNTPADCFERCLALEGQYDVSVIGFSWASEGFQPNGDDIAAVTLDKTIGGTSEESLAKVNAANCSEGWAQTKSRRYAQAKVNSQQSGAALARFLRLLAAARLSTMVQPFSIALHSLGCHFLHYTIGRASAAESIGVAQNVALIAGCTGADQHSIWVQKLKPVKRVYIMYTKDDSVLLAARFIDGVTKLGADPGLERIHDKGYRYVDFENIANMTFGGHRYFVADSGKKLSKQSRLLFTRIFRSDFDFTPADKSLKVVYPLGCNIDNTTCYMGAGLPKEG